MSRTTNLNTDLTARDADSARPTGPKFLLGWISENRWYLIATLFVLMIVRSEARRAETPAMRRNREAIEAMSRIERDRLRHNHSQFQKLDTSEMVRVREIHEAVNSDPQLDATLAQFHAWLATLSLSSREELLAMSEPEDRLQMIRRLMAESDLPATNGRLPSNSQNGSRFQYANLRVSPQDYERMIRAASEWVQHDSAPEAKSPVELLVHHTSVLATVMDRIFPQWRLAGLRTGSRPRVVFPDELRQALLTQLTDPVLKRMIQTRPPSQQNMLAMMLLARGLMEESRRVIKTLRPTEAELDRVYQSLPEPRRRMLDAMSRELADRQLQQQWLSRRLPPVAGEDLSRLFGMFEKLLTRPPAGSRNGSGSKTSGRPESP